jgi:hypothetical protein
LDKDAPRMNRLLCAFDSSVQAGQCTERRTPQTRGNLCDLAAQELPRIWGKGRSALAHIGTHEREARVTKHRLHGNLADRMRNISWRELLRWHGFEIKPEGITCRAKNSRYNIVVTGNRWFDSDAGVGGGGNRPSDAHDWRRLRRRLSNPPERFSGSFTWRNRVVISD